MHFLLKISLLFLCLTTQPLSALVGNTVEIRAAAFFHSSDRFRDIYGNVSGSYQIETSAKIWQRVEGWVNVDQFNKKGHSDSFEEKTKIRITNLSFGLKYAYPFCESFVAYAGIGASCSRVWIKNRSDFYQDTVSKVVPGGVIKSGVCYFITPSVFIDAFADYLYQPVHFQQRTNVGGFKPGLGIGVSF